jgi:hypothetical protein
MVRNFPSLPMVVARVLHSSACYGLYITAMISATLRQLYKHLVLTIGYLERDIRKNMHIFLRNDFYFHNYKSGGESSKF